MTARTPTGPAAFPIQTAENEGMPPKTRKPDKQVRPPRARAADPRPAQGRAPDPSAHEQDKT